MTKHEIFLSQKISESRPDDAAKVGCTSPLVICTVLHLVTGGEDLPVGSLQEHVQVGQGAGRLVLEPGQQSSLYGSELRHPLSQSLQHCLVLLSLGEIRVNLCEEFLEREGGGVGTLQI